MSKNGQNEGSIYQRKDGSWAAQVTIGNQRPTKYFKTRKEANAWRQDMLLQVQNGLTLIGAKATFGEYLASWLETVKTSVRIKTYQQYEQVVRNHILPTLSKVKLKDVTPNNIQMLYKNRLSQGVSIRTVRLIHSVIHRSLHQAVMWRLIGWNPADAVIQPKSVKKEMQTLTEIQVRNLLLTAKGTRYCALFELAVKTGLREGEILGLQWPDIDWKSRQLKVMRQVQRINGEGLIFNEPKTAAGRRLLVLGPSMIEVL